ncbi:hypothetical protein EON77_15030 [bacterium]|nr:MAG: hypothetical protein EON77_15030 [bacterium]
MLSRISLAYIRDYQYSVISNFYGIDRGELSFDALFAGRAAVRLSGGVSAIQYPDIPSRFVPNTIAHPSSTDIRADATLFGEYRFTDSFALNSTLRYMQNVSDIQLPQGVQDPTNPTAPIPAFDFNWRRFEAFIGARWFL